MPGFDGTGPRGKGPMSGHGEGYCAIRLPDARSGRAAYGYAGRAGLPVRLGPRWRLPLRRAVGSGRLRGRSQRLMRRWW
jgi:hypothetical protein